MSDFVRNRNHRLKTLFPDLIGDQSADLVNFSNVICKHYEGKSILEISPCFSPLLDKGSGCQLHYCDRLDYHELKSREQGNAVRVSQGLEVCEIDFILRDGYALDQCAPQKYDLIICSHVMEHVPNWIAWLKGLMRSLKDEHSEIRLILPDAKNSGEYIRRLSTAEYALECYLNNVARPTPSQVYGALLYITEWDNEKNFSEDKNILDYKRWYGFHEAARLAVESYASYIDIHCWAWTAASLAEDITVLSESGVIPLRVMHTQNGYMPGAVCKEFSIRLKTIANYESNIVVATYLRKFDNADAELNNLQTLRYKIKVLCKNYLPKWIVDLIRRVKLEIL